MASNGAGTYTEDVKKVATPTITANISYLATPCILYATMGIRARQTRLAINITLSFFLGKSAIATCFAGLRTPSRAKCCRRSPRLQTHTFESLWRKGQHLPIKAIPLATRARAQRFRPAIKPLTSSVLRNRPPLPSVSHDIKVSQSNLMI